MNQRLLFLSGHLSELLIGAALVWSYFSSVFTKNPTVLTLSQDPVVMPVSYPNSPHIPNPGQVPDGWELRYFIGEPYYIVPLHTVNRDKKIQMTVALGTLGTKPKRTRR